MRPVHRQRFGIAGVRRCSLSSAPASSESAAVPSLCSSWRSGSRQSGGRDHRGLWDGHNPRWLRRRRGASASAPEHPPAIYEPLRAAGPPSFVSAQTGAGSTNGEEAPRKRRPTGVRLTGSFPPFESRCAGNPATPPAACEHLVRRIRVGERLLVRGKGMQMSAQIADEIGSNAPLDKTPVPVAALEAIEIPAADDRL